MLERLAPKLVSKLYDTELLEYIGKPLHPRSAARFEEFCRLALGERERFCGDAEEYLILLITHMNRTFEKFVSLGEFTRALIVVSRKQGIPVVPKYFSQTDEFIYHGILEKLTHAETFTLLVKPLSSGGEHLFVEVRENALIELRDFTGTASAYFTFVLMQVYTALVEVIALHKYGPK